MTPNEYFTRIFCINLARRVDRWAHVEQECRRTGLSVERFEACDNVVIDGHLSAVAGCTASHRTLLELTARHEWPRVLILEDDFEIWMPNFNRWFATMIAEVPDDWDMLYLGGSYAEPPQYRHSRHVIRTGRMMTTSSYAVTAAMARRMAPFATGGNAIDSVYGQFHRDSRCYAFQPRPIVQYANVSDIERAHTDNAQSMLDPHHEDMLLDGTVDGPGPDGLFRLSSTLARFQLSASSDMDGLRVIVERDVFTVVRVEGLPDHPAPWRRGERCTYVLRK